MTRYSRRGSVMIYTAIALPVLMGVCLLAVDLGRVQLAKMELTRAADAAARYAVTGVSDGTALTKANWIGAQNTVAGQGLTFAAGDVKIGTWASNAFTPNGSSPNAVRV